MRVKRTNSLDPDFQMLAGELEADLKVRDGDGHLLFAALNQLTGTVDAVVAYDQDKAVGCGAFRKYDEDTAELKRMFVRPLSRVQGLGSGILAELEKWAAEQGYSNWVLETGRNQPEALGFYLKHSFIMIPRFGRYLQSENSICFHKSFGNLIQ